MIRYKIFLSTVMVGSLLFGITTASAQVKCFPEKIKSMEVLAVGEVYYTTVSGVKRSLTHFSQYGSQAMYEILKHSMNSVQIVQVVYPQDYNCKQPDLKVDALSVIVQDPRVN